MSAFAQGFALGGDIANSAQRNRLAAEAAEREKEKFGWEKEKQDVEKSIRTAALETYGKVGTQDYSQAIQEQGGAGSQQAQMLSDQVAGMGAENEGASAQSVTNAMRQNAGKEALTAALPSKTYTTDQANAEYAKRLYALDPQKAQQMEATGMQLKKGKIELKDLEKQQEFKDWNADISDKMAKGEYASIVENNIGLYNKPPKGTKLNDGLTAKVVPSGVPGGPSNFVQYNKDGKVVASTPITKELVEAEITKLAHAKYKSLNFAEGTKIEQENRKITVQEKEVDAKIPYFKALATEALAKAGQAGAYSEYLRNGGANQNTTKAMAPYLDEYKALSPEERKGPKGQALLENAAIAGAKNSGSITALMGVNNRAADNTLNESDKIAYTALQNSLKDNPPKNDVEMRNRYRMHNLDPEKFIGKDPVLEAFKEQTGGNFFGKKDK